PAARKAIAVDWKPLTRDVRNEVVELAVKTEPIAGNAVRPWDKQVIGEIEWSRARRIVAGAEQRRAPRLADKVIRGETCAQIRNNNGLGDAVVDTEGVRDHHATNHRQYGWHVMSSLS